MLNLRTLILGQPRTCPQTGLQNEPRYSEKPSEFGTVNWTPYQLTQIMETIYMGNLINSRLAFIELIRLLYQISCSDGQDVYKNNCDKLVAVLCQIRTFHLMPLSLLPTSFENMLLNFTDDWQVCKVNLVQTLYIFLARTMYSSVVANIYNSAENKQGLEMCRVQFPYEEIVKWLKDVDFNEQEVLNDYFYFIQTPDVHSFNDAEEYTIYQEKVKSIGFPRFDRHETPVPVFLLHKIQSEFEKALNKIRNYIHTHYSKVENYFEAYNGSVRIYVATRFIDKPKGEVKLVYYYGDEEANNVIVYPYYVDFIHRFHNYECLSHPLTGGYYAGFKEDKPVDDYEYQLKEIHFKLQDIFVSLASDSQLFDYFIFMLRAQMKKVEKQEGHTIMIDDKLWYLDIGDTLNIDIIAIKLQTLKYNGFVFTRRPNMEIQKYLMKHLIEYCSIQDMGWSFYYNNCDELLHLFIKEHLPDLEVEDSNASNFIKGNMLIQRLKRCARGKESWSEYEMIGKEIFDYLFMDDFLNYKSELQSTTDDRLCRRDLIINNSPLVVNSIWGILQQRYNSMLIVVDFKNYQESLSPSALYVPTKYLNRQTGTFGIILTREDLIEVAQKEQLRLVSTEEKALLSISDNSLISITDIAAKYNFFMHSTFGQPKFDTS